ncbi:MAG: hypothetical protein C5B50_07670 [Verrucomicrobia bacterium]|nr:MAG: hypothetical protein C5B50_07670 [Verrucomicrobiota bacterium]
MLITLTTDFGLHDWFASVMQGVIAGLNKRATVLSITHQIAPGDIRSGAFALAAAYRFFPKGTVHLAVVDPGVGSARKPIAVQTSRFFFVGPDNGLLSWALMKEKIKAIHALENEKYFLHPISNTFHGRDIFAPAAAHLSLGLPISKLGPPLKDFVHLPWPEPRRRKNGIEGEILYLDHFGNAITNIDSAALESLGGRSLCVYLGRKPRCPVCDFYQAVPSGKPIAVLGSSAFLEIAINGGNAAKTFSLRPGDPMTVQPRR